MKIALSKSQIMFITIFFMSFSCVLISGTFILNKFDSPKSQAEIVDKDIRDEEIKGIKEEVSFKESINVEINTSLPNEKDYIENLESYDEKDKIELTYYQGEEETLPVVSSLNVYGVKINYLEKEYDSTLNIVDTTKPNVEFKSIAISENAKYDIHDFISSYEDNSGSPDYNITYKDLKNENIKSSGTYSIDLTVCDYSNNCVDGNVKLVVNKKNENQSNSNSNNNNNDNNENNSNTNNTQPPNNDDIITREEKREIINTISYNYGVKKITYQDVVYERHSNGSVKELSRSKAVTKMDYSGFNGTVSSMLNEATGVNKSKENKAAIETFLTNTNAYRQEKGVAPLKLNEDLNIVANIKAMEMAYSNKFDHTRPNGSDWSTLYYTYFNMKKIEIPHKLGENLAGGFSTDLGACEGLRNSQDHYRNMVDKEFTKIGIGRYYFEGTTYWVQVFSS